MANILSIRRRMQTAQNVSKTTRAMQMIAASKLKRAQERALSSRYYVEKLTSVTKNLSERVSEEEKSEYMKIKSRSEKKLLIVISPDKGLCGGLTTNLTKELLADNTDSNQKEYVVIGKKLEKTVSRLGKDMIAFFEFGTTLPSFDIIYPIAKIIDDEFLSGKVSEVKILYSHFMTVFTQIAKISALLPIKIEESPTDKKDQNSMLFEPAPKEILPTILRHYLEMSLYQFILESYASEQAARMVAMKNATENAQEIIDYLRLEYNKQRQEKITNEILDIGSAATAMMYE